MEHYRVDITDQAKADIRAAARYIAEKLRQPDTAEKLLDSFDDAVTSLEEMPERYGLVQDKYLARLGIHLTSVGHYLLFYQVDHATHTASILRVLHGRRDWLSILTTQSERE